MENNEKNKTIILVIAAILALCGCLMVSCCAAAFYSVSRMNRETISELLSNGNAETPGNTAAVPTQEEQSGAEVTLTDPEIGGLSAEEQKIIRITEETRGISAAQKMAPIYKTSEELRQDLIDQLQEVTDDEFAEELGLYNILGFAPEDFDLRQFYVDLYTEQIAGFYDPEENQMYLIADISARENALTLAHEYTHYLQYNNPDFQKTLHYEDDFCEENGETCLILDALTEGDASLTENLVDAEDILLNTPDSQAAPDTASASVFDNAPKFFQDSLLFPYVYGFDFTAYHYMRGGFEAVDRMYNALPESIEQIMHPEKYGIDHPVPVTLEPFRSMIKKDFDIIQDDTLNEADILQILGSGWDADWQLSERQAAAGADGWGGGAYIYAKNDGSSLFFTKVIWDSEKEAEEAENAFQMYCDKRFGSQTAANIWQDENGASVRLIRQDDILYWMILPDHFDTENFVGLIQNGSAL